MGKLRKSKKKRRSYQGLRTVVIEPKIAFEWYFCAAVCLMFLGICCFRLPTPENNAYYLFFVVPFAGAVLWLVLFNTICRTITIEKDKLMVKYPISRKEEVLWFKDLDGFYLLEMMGKSHLNLERNGKRELHLMCEVYNTARIKGLLNKRSLPYLGSRGKTKYDAQLVSIVKWCTLLSGLMYAALQIIKLFKE